MNYFLEKLIPVFSVIIAWFLGFRGQHYLFLRQDKIKLRRLLYNLLELRHWVGKEMHLELQLEGVIDLFFVELQKRMPIPPEQLSEMRSFIIGAIRRQFQLQPKMPDLESSIETIVKELAEVDPVFAFELTGRFHITEKIGAIQAYIDQIEVPAGEDATLKNVLVDKLLRPTLMADAVKELDKHIREIAAKISRKVAFDVKKISFPTENAIDQNEVLDFLNDYIPGLLNLVPQSHSA